MVVIKTFVRSVPASEDTVFEVNGNVDGGIQIMLQNLSEDNTMTYRIQESYDGIEWVDKTFTTSNGGSSTTFVILPSSHHGIKVLYTRQKIRLLASGNLLVQASLTFNVASGVESGQLIVGVQ